MEKNVISSPIRWAGSKKRLLNELLLSFDKSKKTYVEPFLGSRNRVNKSSKEYR